MIPAVEDFDKLEMLTKAMENVHAAKFQVDDYGRINGQPLTQFKGRKIGVAIFELEEEEY